MDTPVKKLSNPALRLYRINAGSCNGCDVELAATAALSRFSVERLGCSYTEDPTHADIVLITGPLTVRVREKVLRCYAQVPEPKVTVLVGVCPISGGVFRDSYAVSGPVDSYLPVDVNVPGCPPRPQAIVAGIAEAARLWREGLSGQPNMSGAAGPLDGDPDCAGAAPAGLRGRMAFNPAACVGCRMCEHVCAGGAIRFDELADGLKFTLWHNSCVSCGLCSHYCPTKALSTTGQWQSVHRQKEKYRQVERGIVPLVPCSGCGSAMLPVAPELLRVAYRGSSRATDRLRTLCTACRQQQSIGGLAR
jgi:Ni,Fe-hydrogenase III small subunit/Fe-S-cluster-containing hydrogenase component 2